MPDLGDLSAVPLMSYYIAKVVFHGTRMSADRTLNAYITSFIRILDKAIWEYDQSRKNLQAYIDSANKITLILKAVSHLETCVHSVRRCLHLFERMRDLELGDQEGLRQLRRLIRNKLDVVVDVRDAIEHIDEKVAKDELTEGETTGLMIGEVGDRASIAGKQILFSDLANALRNLHRFAVQLCEYRDPVGNK